MAVGRLAGVDAVDRELHDSGSSVSGPKVATIECSGRTHTSEPDLAERAPQRIDFGQGKVRMMTGKISASTSSVGAAGLLDQRDIEIALLVGLDLRLADRGQAGRLQKALDRGVGRADARAATLLLQIRLAARECRAR